MDASGGQTKRGPILRILTLLCRRHPHHFFKSTSHTTSFSAAKYTFKPAQDPKIYLGAEIGRYLLADCRTWYMSAENHLKKAISTIEETIGPIPTKHVETPLPTG